MLAQERRDAILRALLPSGAATVADLAAGLAVGGAVLARGGGSEPHSATRRRINAPTKAAIAEAAAARSATA